MTTRATLVSIGLATSALAVGFCLDGLWLYALPVVLLGGLWAVGIWRRWSRGASALFVAFAGLSVVGLWAGVGRGWALITVVAALSAWDLEHFARRVRAVPVSDATAALERHHLRRLLTVDATGLVLSAAALLLRARPGFGVVALLSLLAAVGLSYIVRYLQAESRG